MSGDLVLTGCPMAECVNRECKSSWALYDGIRRDELFGRLANEKKLHPRKRVFRMEYTGTPTVSPRH